MSYIGGILKDNVFQPVLKKGFLLASLADDIQSASITDLACEDHEIAQLRDLCNVDCKSWLI